MNKENSQKSLTRKQLYDLIWTKPATQVAKDFGLSDRGLGKLCERNGIPVPPRGYWAKKAAGQKIKKPPLLLFNVNDDRPVLTKIEKILTANDGHSESSLSAEMQEIVDYEKDTANKITVPKKTVEYHSVIKTYENERKRWDDSRVISRLNRRIYRILTAFLKALEQRGFKVIYEDSIWKIKVQNDADFVYIGLDEYIKRTRHEVTDEDKKGYYYGNAKYKFIDEKTDKLKFYIYTGSGNLHKSFIETDEKPLETMLNDIAVEIIKEILHSRRSRLQREESERRYYERQERIRKEQEKRENLLRDIKNRETAQSIRKYVTECSLAHQAGELEQNDFESWKQWALAFADEVDPINIT